MAYCTDGSIPNSLNQCADGSYASDTGSVDISGNPVGGSSSSDALNWITQLSGLTGSVYKTVTAITSPPAVVAGRGIPGSPGSLTPVQTTGVGTLLVIGLVALLVWFGLRR